MLRGELITLPRRCDRAYGRPIMHGADLPSTDSCCVIAGRSYLCTNGYHQAGRSKEALLIFLLSAYLTYKYHTMPPDEGMETNPLTLLL